MGWQAWRHLKRAARASGISYSGNRRSNLISASAGEENGAHRSSSGSVNKQWRKYGAAWRHHEAGYQLASQRCNANGSE